MVTGIGSVQVSYFKIGEAIASGCFAPTYQFYLSTVHRCFDDFNFSPILLCLDLSHIRMSSEIRKFECGHEKHLKKKKFETLIMSQKGALDKLIVKKSPGSPDDQGVDAFFVLMLLELNFLVLILRVHTHIVLMPQIFMLL